MDFEIPADLAAYLAELDEFIERQIRPLKQQDDNVRFFDHRREDARTDWDRGGLPSREWEALLAAGLHALEVSRRPPSARNGRRPAAPAPHGRPTASELLEAVREFLTGQVMPASAGQVAFHARVAANVLGIVARELELGAIASDASLAEAVAAKLAVANPRYFDTIPPAP